MKRLPLSGVRGEGKCALVDDEDFERLAAHRWFFQKRYAYRTVRIGHGRQRSVYLHREVMGVGSRESDPREIDHINNDGLDNQRTNLRFVSRGENEQNKSGPSVRSKTGVRGVIRTRYGRFRAVVHVHGRNVFHKHFLTLEEASVAVGEARRRFMTHAPECR